MTFGIESSIGVLGPIIIHSDGDSRLTFKIGIIKFAYCAYSRARCMVRAYRTISAVVFESHSCKY